MLFASYNIQYGLGRDGRYDIDRAARDIAHADVIALQEVERFWQRSGMIDEPAEIAARLPDHYWVFGANLDVDASFRDDGGRLVNRRRQFGTMILSRFPILSSRNFPLPKFGALATQHSIQQGVLEAVLDPGSGPIRLYSTHLSHLCPETRLPQIEAILDMLARAPAEGGAWCGGHPDPDAGWTEGTMPPMPRDVVFMGDLNFDQASAEYGRMIGPVSKYGRLVNRDGLVDAWVAAGNPEAEGKTHPNDRRIDHCFVSAGVAPRVRRAWADTTAMGSDHYPLFVEFDF